MSYGINYTSVLDYEDMERQYTVKHSVSPETGETIARTTINGHTFEARHLNPMKATTLLGYAVEDAEMAGKTIFPPDTP